MLEQYREEQSIITNLLLKSIESNKLVQAYLFVCDDIDYIFDYAKAFTKEIIKKSNLDENTLDKIYKRIDKNEYSEFKIIEPDGNFIKKEQLSKLQKDTLTKPVEGNKIVYIIKNCEKLNSSSANSILKFLEEPVDDLIAILLTNNINSVIPTIKSRCQILNFKSTKGKIDEINSLEKIIDLDKITDLEIKEKIIDSSIDVLESIEKKKQNTFINEKDLLWDKFKTTDEILILINVLIHSYMEVLHLKMYNKLFYMDKYSDIISYISSNNELDNIIGKINILEKIKNSLIYNLNSKLLFDRIIIELSEA